MAALLVVLTAFVVVVGYTAGAPRTAAARIRGERATSIGLLDLDAVQ